MANLLDILDGVQTFNIDGETWFLGLDIAGALGYVRTRNAIAKHCLHAKSILELLGKDHGTGLQGASVLILESDVYRLIMKCQLPIVVDFIDWISSNALPSLNMLNALPNIDLSGSDKSVNKVGQIYAVLFNNDVVKVGRTSKFNKRMQSHAITAKLKGIEILDILMSGTLANSFEAEEDLIEFCNEHGSASQGSEWFKDIDFKLLEELFETKYIEGDESELIFLEEARVKNLSKCCKNLL